MAMTTDTRSMLAVGTEVDVYSTFRQGWVSGFEIAAVRDSLYAIRRQVDWAVLPGMFKADDLCARRAPSA